jgi:branched-chain amino acid transport system permease protein
MLTLLIGLSEGLILVLVAVGLTLTFGTMRILNMAHGGFFMMGGYFLYTFTTTPTTASWGLFVDILLSVVCVTIIGCILERVFYRRLYGREGLYGLLVSFALLLAFQGAVETIWGNNPVSVSLSWAYLNGATSVFGGVIPTYYLAVIAVTLVVSAALGFALHRNPIGRAARAIALDREMSAALGLNVRRVFQITFAAGCALAAFAGALLAPEIQLESDVGGTYIILAFALVLIGGLDSIPGTVVAGIAVGLVDTLATTYLPVLSGYAVYIFLLLVLLIRPNGLFGSSPEVSL